MTVARLARVLRLRWRSVTGAASVDADLDRELAFHFDQLVREQIAAGLDPSAAAREARRAIGNLASAKESARDERRVRWLHDLAQDVRYAARQLRAAPGFTVTATASLALAIGINAATLTAIDVLLRRPLPLPRVDRLVVLNAQNPIDRRWHDQASMLEWRNWQQRTHTFEAFVGTFGGERDIAADGDLPAERVDTRAVSAGWFDVLGLRPYRGRFFTADDYRNVSSVDAVVIGYDWWRRRYHADPDVIGRMLRTGDLNARIVGIGPVVMPYQARSVQAWFPLRLRADQPATPARVFRMLALLKPGVRLADAQADVDAASQAIAGALPPTLDWRSMVVPITTAERGWLRQPLLDLQGVATLVLLVAAANVIGALLARHAARRHELAMRSALGASRGRLMRQMLAETLLLAGIAAPVALAFAAIVLRFMPAILTPPLGASAPIVGGLSWGLAAIDAIVAAAVALVVGFPPTIVATRPSAMHAPAPTAHARHTRARSWRHAAALTIQLAGTFTLIVIATVVIRSVARLSLRDLHVDPARLVMFQLRADGPAPSRTFTGVLDALQGLQDVEAVGGISDWSLTTIVLPTVTVRAATSPSDHAATSVYSLVTPGLFHAMGTPVLDGREFDGRDGEDAPWGVVVNHAAAAQLWPNGGAVGQMVRLDREGEQPRRVLGIVADIPLHREDLRATPIVYASYRQQPPYRSPAIGAGLGGRMVFLVRARSTTASAAAAATRAVAALRPGYPFIYQGEVAAPGIHLVELWIYGAVLGGAALGAIVLALVGLHSVLSLALAQETREIGIRAALGASPSVAARSIIRLTVAVWGAGMLIGLLAAVIVPRLFTSRLWDQDPTDPAAIGVAAAAITLTVAAASWRTLRRALHLLPAAALRDEPSSPRR